ncbi:MAG: hypothetical protein LBV79_04515 [Candidatus Adiutrix sp.]|jgi:hypothetical protein|nr:hypothetical protein [Candidatus Adiutrix sp.]
MSIDLATLELKVRSEGVAEASRNLEKFSGQAKTTESAAGTLSARFADMARTYDQLARTQGQSPLGASLEVMSAQLSAVGSELEQLSAPVIAEPLAEELSLAGEALDRFGQTLDNTFTRRDLSIFNVGGNRELQSLADSLMTEEEAMAASYQRRLAIIEEHTSAASELRLELTGRLSAQYEGQLADFEAAQERQRDSLYNGLLSEEEMLAQSYARRQEMILESTLVTEEERLDLMKRLTQQYNAELGAMENARIQTLLGGAQNMFDGLAGLAKSFSGKQSQAYRVMFAISKGFAVAQAALSIATGLAKAQELGFPANLGEMARVAATGASIVSQINSSNYAGAYDRGGYIPGGKVGLVGEYGPELVRGPATVTGREATAKLAREAGRSGASGGRSITINATYVLQDKADLDQFRASKRQMDADLARSIKRAQA